jgi:hypothetical protein
MDDRGQKLAFQLLAERFKRCAMATNFGYIDEDKALQLAGLRGIGRTIRDIDLFGPQARRALTPLLDDDDASTRAFAAKYLLKLAPERALAVLKHVEANGPTEARITAGGILFDHARGDLDV